MKKSSIQSVAFRRPAAAAARSRRGGPLLVAGLVLAVLAASAWFFATGHAVRIESDPADSSIALRGGFSLPVAGRHFARPGQYQVEIRRAGYETLQAPLSVTDAADQSHRFRLAKLPGIVEVKSPVSARVSVAGKDVGAVPGRFRLPAGPARARRDRAASPAVARQVDVAGMRASGRRWKCSWWLHGPRSRC